MPGTIRSVKPPTGIYAVAFAFFVFGMVSAFRILGMVFAAFGARGVNYGNVTWTLPASGDLYAAARSWLHLPADATLSRRRTRVQGVGASQVSGAMMFLKGTRAPEHTLDIEVTHQEDDAIEGIRCPHCRWRPSASDRWCCACESTPEPPFPSCGTAWNTFETRGRCPGCDHQWKWTSCLRCHKWSEHEAWYHSE